MSRWKFIAVWLTALAGTMLITWQIVAVADTQIGSRPAELASPGTTLPGAVDSTTSSTISRTSTTLGSATTSTSVGTSSTTSLDDVATTAPTAPTTTIPGASTSTSTTHPEAEDTSAPWSVKTIISPGGTVVVTHRSGQVLLQAATPLVGFTAELEDGGPDRVRVDFEKPGSRVRVDVEWDHGVLDVEINVD